MTTKKRQSRNTTKKASAKAAARKAAPNLDVRLRRVARQQVEREQLEQAERERDDRATALAIVGGLGKKPLSRPDGRELAAMFGALSKAAVLDLLGDALELAMVSGFEDWAEFAKPRLRVRGDRVPASWRPGVLLPLPRPEVVR